MLEPAIPCMHTVQEPRVLPGWHKCKDLPRSNTQKLNLRPEREEQVVIITPHSLKIRYPLNSLGLTFINIPHLETLPAAGHLQYCLENWALISSDPWLPQVRSYQLELITQPHQRKPPCPMAVAEKDLGLISDEVQKLCAKHGIKQADPSPDQFLSQIFLALNAQ